MVYTHLPAAPEHTEDSALPMEDVQLLTDTLATNLWLKLALLAQGACTCENTRPFCLNWSMLTRQSWHHRWLLGAQMLSAVHHLLVPSRRRCPW
jgi:hypothetical protein